MGKFALVSGGGPNLAGRILFCEAIWWKLRRTNERNYDGSAATDDESVSDVSKHEQLTPR